MVHNNHCALFMAAKSMQIVNATTVLYYVAIAAQNSCITESGNKRNAPLTVVTSRALIWASDRIAEWCINSFVTVANQLLYRALLL